MPDPFSLFPQALAPAHALDPSAILGLADQVNKLQLFQKDFAARQATGDAYAAARRPDGSTDINALTSGLRDRPAANWNAQENARHMVDLQRGQAELSARRQGDFINDLGTLATKRGVTMDDINSAAARAAARGASAVEIMPTVEEFRKIAAGAGGKPEALSAALRARLADMQAISIGSGGVAGETRAPPGPAGEPQNQLLGERIRGGGVPGGVAGGAMPTDLPPGETVPMAGAAGRAEALQSTATTSPQYHADLENLKRESRVLGQIGGPTTEIEKHWAQVANRLGIPEAATMTPEQLRALEGYDKIASMISANQAKLAGAATDAGRHMAVGMNPSTGMSAYGREGVTDMLMGNQDWIDTARGEWLKSGLPANAHDRFMQQFGTGVDPRVFQFNRLSKENQSKFWNGLTADEAADFKRKYAEAIRRKWVERPK